MLGPTWLTSKKLSSNAEQAVNEIALPLYIALRYPTNLTFAD